MKDVDFAQSLDRQRPRRWQSIWTDGDEPDPEIPDGWEAAAEPEVVGGDSGVWFPFASAVLDRGNRMDPAVLWRRKLVKDA